MNRDFRCPVFVGLGPGRRQPHAITRPTMRITKLTGPSCPAIVLTLERKEPSTCLRIINPCRDIFEMHLILTGATGLVGSGVLQYVLSVPDKVTKLSVLSRKPVPLAEGHAQVTVIQHDDFSSYPADLLEKLKGAEGCIWALGVSQNAVNKESASPPIHSPNDALTSRQGVRQDHKGLHP